MALQSSDRAKNLYRGMKDFAFRSSFTVRGGREAPPGISCPMNARMTSGNRFKRRPSLHQYVMSVSSADT